MPHSTPIYHFDLKPTSFASQTLRITVTCRDNPSGDETEHQGPFQEGSLGVSYVCKQISCNLRYMKYFR